MSASPLNLLLVDEDPVFRLGLRIWLEQRVEFRIMGEASTAEEALRQITAIQTIAQTGEADTPATTETPRLNLVILDLGLGRGKPSQLPGLRLCQQIKRQFPDLPVLVLSAQGEPVLQTAARQMGADGFGLRGLPVRELARLIRQVATASAPVDTAPVDTAADITRSRPEGPLSALRRDGLRQIEAAIAQVEAQQRRGVPSWYGFVLSGQHRELRAARWLVQQILPAPGRSMPTPSEGESETLAASAPAPAAGSLTLPRTSLPVTVGDVRARVCEAVYHKLQFPLDNRSDIPLEIDILRPGKTQALLYLVLNAFEDQLDDLQQAQLEVAQIPQRVPELLRDLWQTVITHFFGRYAQLQVNGTETAIATALSEDAAIVQADILDKIPQVSTLLQHLLFQAPVVVEQLPQDALSTAALSRSQQLLENLLIQVACAVVQPLLNRFAEVESLKQDLYQQQFASSRDIARFRNELSWRYRWDHLVKEPQAIFESRYRLFILTPRGILTQDIYAPRQAELNTLSTAQYALTLALEARDAIAPRLRAVISLVGSALVYVLTEIIGRGIGLIGRGIFKGIGSAWQESRLRRPGQNED